ncbi:hypothetical protein [Microbulbifer sp. TYP-18]|uniref:hypothetical protein n=1 Tax=Microbulbifer sp. TYP-18 TaxID=3230024 RepID=UPI0034C6CB15
MQLIQTPSPAGVLLALLAVLVGCGSQSARSGELPALLVQSTAENRAELQRVLSSALNGAPVLVAEDAFTRESILVIQRSPPQEFRQGPLQGRDMGHPERFRLMMDDGGCWLKRLADGSRWKLEGIDCVPEPQRDAP